MFRKRIENLPSRPFGYAVKSGRLFCEDSDICKIVNDFETATYVYSAQRIVEGFSCFQAAFSDRRHLICYAVKANPNLGILRLLAKHGAGFDIVSGGELERVLTVSRRAASRVVFSGVGKTAVEMDQALRNEIRLFNVESEAELDLLAERAAKMRRKARIALRVNPDVFAETHPYISTGLSEHKFGIALDAAADLYRRASKMRWIEPVGVSVHIGSQIRSADPFGAAVARVVELMRSLRREGIHLQSIDVGGGVGIEYALSGFDFKDAVGKYADSVKHAVGSLDVELLLEPGRAIVGPAGALITKVLYVKKSGSKTFVITDAAMNDLIRPTLYGAHHEIVPVVRRRGARRLVVDVVGPVCETGDFFARDREMDEVFPGDLLAILDAGAYGMSLSSNYNSRPRVAEVLVSGKRHRLIRKRESMRDLLRAEMV